MTARSHHDHQKKPNAKDVHHILYQRKFYTELWAKRLRENPYMKVKIPTYTLHQKIHDTIHDIPCPNEDACEYVWHDIEDMRLLGIIDDGDNIIQKINVLIELLGYCDGNMEATIATLKWQRDVAHKFYFGTPS